MENKLNETQSLEKKIDSLETLCRSLSNTLKTQVLKLTQINSLLIEQGSDVLDVHGAARVLHTSVDNVYRLKSAGIISYSKPHGKLYFSKKWLEEYALSNQIKSKDERSCELDDSISKEALRKIKIPL